MTGDPTLGYFRPLTLRPSWPSVGFVIPARPSSSRFTPYPARRAPASADERSETEDAGYRGSGALQDEPTLESCPSVLTTRSTPRSLGLSLATLPPFPSVTSETSGDRGRMTRDQTSGTSGEREWWGQTGRFLFTYAARSVCHSIPYPHLYPSPPVPGRWGGDG